MDASRALVFAFGLSLLIVFLVLATVLTLFVVPLSYALLARFTSPSNRIARKIKTLENDLAN